MYKNIIWRAFKKIGNLTFAIILLLVISLYIVLGTFIEQEKGIDYYQSHYSSNSYTFFTYLNWRWIKYLQLDHIYTSWIFVLLLITLGLSLIVCTFSTQLPTIGYARRWKFRKYYNQTYMSVSSNNILISYSSVVYYLIKNYYTVFHQKNYFYAHKGLIGRISPIFVHLSLVLLLLGSLMTFFGSIIVQEMIPVGENFHLQNIVKSGLFSSIPKHFFCQVSSFSIDYYDSKDIKQFYTKLTISYKKNLIKSKVLSVNKPIIMDGLFFYQTDWQVNGLRLLINNIVVQIPIQKLYHDNQNFWISTISYDYDQEKVFSIIFSDVDNKIFIYNKKGSLIHDISLNQNIIMNHTNIKILNVIKSTGLQIKKDPGTRLVYMGFFILIVSTVGSYLSYSQVWVIIFPLNLCLSGFTNRADVKFEKEFIVLSKYIK